MLTMNYYRLCRTRLAAAWIEMLCVDGNMHKITSWPYPFHLSMCNYTEYPVGSAGVSFLGEYVEPGLNKYTVEGDVLIGCVHVSPATEVVWGENNNCLEATVTMGVLGLVDETVIKGISLHCRGYDEDGVTQLSILMDITPLDTPITINKGETKQITYTVRLNSGV